MKLRIVKVTTVSGHVVYRLQKRNKFLFFPETWDYVFWSSSSNTLVVDIPPYYDYLTLDDAIHDYQKCLTPKKTETIEVLDIP